MRSHPTPRLLQVDGCGDNSYYPTGYPTMGNALIATGRDIQFSCSWPAYLGDNETTKPWQQIIDAGAAAAPRSPVAASHNRASHSYNADARLLLAPHPAECDSGRNWDDVQPSWASLVSIIDHYGDYSA